MRKTILIISSFILLIVCLWYFQGAYTVTADGHRRFNVLTRTLNYAVFLGENASFDSAVLDNSRDLVEIVGDSFQNLTLPVESIDDFFEHIGSFFEGLWNAITVPLQFIYNVLVWCLNLTGSLFTFFATGNSTAVFDLIPYWTVS